jgi:hypothetical protein
MKYVRERRERQGKSSIGLLGPFGKAFLEDDWRSPLYVQELIQWYFLFHLQCLEKIDFSSFS